MVLDRYGGPTGKYLARPNVSAQARGLGERMDRPIQYRLNVNLMVQGGIAARARALFSPGGKLQFMTDKEVGELVCTGVLTQISEGTAPDCSKYR